MGLPILLVAMPGESVSSLTSGFGSLHTALNDTRADRVTGEAGSFVNVEFAHQVGAVLFDRLDADA
nr:hypothetical protein [Coraliomargarita sinensis]